MAIPSTQQKSLQEPSPNQAFFTEASSWKADGLHFTVEGKSLVLSTAQWERVERGWEMPEPFRAHWQAVAVARTLVLRFDGDRVFRVVDPRGKVVQVFFVKKHLFILEEGQDTENLEEIPAGFDPPLVSEVLNDEIQRKRVFLTLIDPCEVFRKCRQMMTHLQLRILALKHQLYQPFYVHITSDQTLIENQPHYFLTRAEALEDRYHFLKGLYGRGYASEEQKNLNENAYLEDRYAEGDYGTVVAKVNRPFPIVQAQGPEGMVTLQLSGFEGDSGSPMLAPLHALPKRPGFSLRSWVYTDEDGECFQGEEVEKSTGV